MLSDSDSETNDEIINKTYFRKYHCIKKLGQGSFGSIYKAEYNGEYFALKFEDRNKGQNLLESEAAIMNYLKGPNIPIINSFGSTVYYNILVMQLLGKSLEDIFELRKNFTLKTICMIGYQMISVLEYIHNKHIVHRDIKPDNFVMGLDEKSQYVYLLDFGLAKKYRSSITLVHFPLVNRKKLIGTARYASINASKGFEQSRRDDLESAGYVLLYFLRGSLPWQGQKVKNKDERHQKILKIKIETSVEDLCKGFPEEFAKYLEYTRNLEYEENPDYNMLRGLLKSVMRKENFSLDYIYDWTTDKEIRSRNSKITKSDYETQGNGTSVTSRKLQTKNNDFIVNSANVNDISPKREKINEDRLNNIRETKDEMDYKNDYKNEYITYRKLKKSFNDDGRMKNKEENNYAEDDSPDQIVCCSSACNIF